MELIQNENGASINGAPLTTSYANRAVPGLLRNAIDERIVKIRPMATPIDQLTRCAGARHCNAMKVDYYCVDVKPVSSCVKTDFYGEDLGNSAAEAADTSAAAGIDGDADDDATKVTFFIHTENNRIFSPTETVMIPSATDAKGNPAVFYVIGVDRDRGLELRWINGDRSRLSELYFAKGAEVVRMGRAATELDVQTSQFEALPVKRTQNCQIFKMQVEQSTFQKLANKEVGWNFSDQEEVAVIDMRQGMEKNFLFGQKATFTDPEKNEEVYLTGGIWGQTDKTWEYNPATLSATHLIELCRKAFTGAGGNSRKILIGGSGLIEAMSKINYDKTLDAGRTFTKWGIEFKEVRSNFGSLYVLHSEIFDQCGHADDGFVLDPDCMTKYCHVPFHAETLDLRRSGVRNTDAVVLTEAACLVLRHPQAHCRIIANRKLS